MTWSIRLLRVRGIPIRVHLTFLVVLGFLAWRTWSSSGILVALTELLVVLLLFACVMLHELGHALVALHRGVSIAGITLYPFGGVAMLGERITSPRVEVEIAAAGPLVNLAVAAAVLVGSGGTAISPGASVAARLAYVLLWANLLLAGFNLLPAFPLDGGRILRGVLTASLGRVRATVWSASLGQVAAVLMVGVGLFHAPWLALAGLLLFPGANPELQRALGLRQLERLRVADLMLTNIETFPSRRTLSEVAERSRQTPMTEFVVDQDGQWVGFLPATRLWSLVHEGANGLTPIGEVALPLAQPVAPETPIREALEKLQAAGCQATSVVRAGSLVGLVTLASLTRSTALVKTLMDREEEGESTVDSRQSTL